MANGATTGTTAATATAAGAGTVAAPSLLMRPIAWIPEARRPQVAITLLILVALAFPFYIDSNDADVDSMANAAAYATLALGLNIVVGFAGLLDLGYAAFFAIGAYTYGVLTAYQLQPPWNSFWEVFQTLGLATPVPADIGTGMVVHFTLSFWLALPLAAAIAAFFGVLFGAPTLRLRGDYLAIVTLGFGEIVPIVVRNWSDLTNGAAGLNGVAAPQLFGWSFGVNSVPYYYVAITMVAMLIFISIRLRDSRIGRAWMAIREDEIAAGAMGVDRTRFKLLAFAIGAAFAGMTGVFYVAKLQTATPEMFGFPVSVMILVMVVFGGMGSVWGVVLGAFILQLLQSWWLQDLTEWTHMLGRAVGSTILQKADFVQSIELIFGLILVFMMLFRRQGLIPAVRHQKALTFEQQHAEIRRGGFTDLKLQGLGGEVRTGDGNQGRHRALRRPDRAEQGRHHRADGQRGRGDRTERLRQVHTVQRHHRAGGHRRRFDPLPRRGADRVAAAYDPGKGRCAHVPEPAAVHQHDGDGQRTGQPAHAAQDRRAAGDPAPALNAGGGEGGARVGDGGVLDLRQPTGAARRADGGRPVLRQSAPYRDRPRPGLAP